MLESLRAYNKDFKLYALVRKGNEGLLKGHPFLEDVFVFDKKKGKVKNILKIASELANLKLDVVFNCQRFLSSGILATLSKSKKVIGFDKNPMALFYTKKIKHEYKDGWHEIDRNHSLLQAVWADIPKANPKLYPSEIDNRAVEKFLNDDPIIVCAPASVWFTKQLPVDQWLKLFKRHNQDTIYLIGGRGDVELCDDILKKSNHTKVISLAGKLNLLESCSLISKAKALYANDSAPTHFGTAMEVPTHTFFCSTTPQFGFGPKASVSFIHQYPAELECRPCGSH